MDQILEILEGSSYKEMLEIIFEIKMKCSKCSIIRLPIKEPENSKNIKSI